MAIILLAFGPYVVIVIVIVILLCLIFVSGVGLPGIHEYSAG